MSPLSKGWSQQYISTHFYQCTRTTFNSLRKRTFKDPGRKSRNKLMFIWPDQTIFQRHEPPQSGPIVWLARWLIRCVWCQARNWCGLQVGCNPMLDTGLVEFACQWIWRRQHWWHLSSGRTVVLLHLSSGPPVSKRKISPCLPFDYYPKVLAIVSPQRWPRLKPPHKLNTDRLKMILGPL